MHDKSFGSRSIYNSQNAGPIRVLVADDHAMILDIADLYLSQQTDICVETAQNFKDAAKKMAAEPRGFDVVLLDYIMPGMNGLEGLQRALASPKARYVALITGAPNRAMMNDALELGASGIIPKSIPMKSLANAIRFINSGELYMPLSLVSEDAYLAQETGPLSQREMTVLSYLGEGKKNKEIAAHLELSEGTIKMHVMSICKKLDANNRTHAVINARNSGLLR